jgi:hypothetical protein
MEDTWVACPRCGHAWDDKLAQRQGAETQPRRTSWYPSKQQWWVIWSATALVVMGVMAGGAGLTFAFCVTLVGLLVVWKLQKQL